MVRVNGLMYPQPNIWIMTGASGPGIAQVIDATGEKFAWTGQVRFYDGDTSKSINKFHFNPATVTSAGGSGMTLSLQDMDTATGNPPRPDGTADQSCSFLLSTLTTNTWFTSPAFTPNRTVSRGDWLAVVIEYDGSGRLGSDALNFAHNPISNGIVAIPGTGDMALFQSGFWSSNFSGGAWGQPQCALEFSDGTFGSIGNSLPHAFFSGDNFNTSTASDEYAMHFQVPFDCTADGAWIQLGGGGPGNNRGQTIDLYGPGEGSTTSLLTAPVNLDSEFTWAASPSLRCDVTFPNEVTLTRNTTYYLSCKATTIGNVSNSRFSMYTPASGYMDGTALMYQSRRKGGAWTDNTGLRPNMGVRICKIDDGA